MAANPVVPSSELHLDTERTETETIIRCSGRIISSTSDVLREAVRSAIPQNRTIVLDLSSVNYMDSSGLGALVGAWTSARRAGRELKLISLSQRVKELLHLTALDKVFAASRFPDNPSF
jgi:anti-sigma B factor antagonist